MCNTRQESGKDGRCPEVNKPPVNKLAFICHTLECRVWQMKASLLTGGLLTGGHLVTIQRCYAGQWGANSPPPRSGSPWHSSRRVGHQSARQTSGHLPSLPLSCLVLHHSCFPLIHTHNNKPERKERCVPLSPPGKTLHTKLPVKRVTLQGQNRLPIKHVTLQEQ